MLGAKRATKTLQERTNLPDDSQKLLNGATKKPQWDDNDYNRLPQVMKHNQSQSAYHHHHQQQLRHPRSNSASDTVSTPLMKGRGSSTGLTAATDVDSLPQIRLLHTAVNLLKVHAEDAGSNIEKLRVLLANRDTEPTAYRSLQRQRFLEERRELDAHRALWSTTRKVSAILQDDIPTLEAQQLSDHSLGLFNYHAPPQPSPDRASRVREHTRLIPLTLASKADYRPPKRASKPPPLVDSSTSSSSSDPSTSSSYTPPLYRMPSGKSGTAAIFHAHQPALAKADRERLAQRIKDVELEITMPDYVGDLLSEFDSASNPPLLPLTSPETSPLKRSVELPLGRSMSPTKASRPVKPLDGIVEEKGSGAASGGRTSEHQPRVLKRKGSQKRFSNLFSSKKSPGGAPPSSFPGDPTLSLQLPMGIGDNTSSFMSPPPLSSAATTSSAYPSSMASPLRSSISMSGLNGEDSVSPSVETRSPKRFSAASVISLVSPSGTHGHHHHQRQGSAEEKERENDGVTSRIKKRFSRLRG